MDNEYQIEIDLWAALLYLSKKMKLIVVLTFVCAVAGFLISYFLIPPEYEVSTRIYVLNRGAENVVSYSDYQISNQIIEDYKVLITGQNVTKKVIQELKLDMSVKELEKKIEVTAPANTRVLQITVTDTDPMRAVNIANQIRQIASDQLQKIMNVESVNLVYEAELPEEPVGPNVVKITIISAGLGLVLIVVVLIFVHIVDDTIRTEEDVEQSLGISVLGVIPADEEMGYFASKEQGVSPKRMVDIWSRRNERYQHE